MISESIIRATVKEATDEQLALMLRLIAERVSSRPAAPAPPSSDLDLIRRAEAMDPGSTFVAGVREHYEKRRFISPKQRSALERIALGESRPPGRRGPPVEWCPEPAVGDEPPPPDDRDAPLAQDSEPPPPWPFHPEE